MNILPKKSWHVLARKNVEKVREDEAKAKAREEELAERARLAEQEARVCLMRKRARQRDGLEEEEEEEQGEPVVVGQDQQHINFFSDLSKGVGLHTTNTEHEKEKKKDQEKIEKRIGLLTYLVDKDRSDDPWYVRPEEGKESARSKHWKEKMDPLGKMNQLVAVTKKRRKEFPSSGHSSTSRSSDKHHRGAGEREGGSEAKKKKKSLEEMRRERERREEAEKTRTEAALRRHFGCGGLDPSQDQGPQAVEESRGRYNSQFNPHIARQNR